MARKIRILLIGQASKEIRDEMIKWLFHYGSKTVIITEKQPEADLAVNITALSGTSDIRAEAMFTIQSAKQVQETKENLKKLKKLQNGSNKNNSSPQPERTGLDAE